MPLKLKKNNESLLLLLILLLLPVFQFFWGIDKLDSIVVEHCHICGEGFEGYDDDFRFYPDMVEIVFTNLCFAFAFIIVTTLKFFEAIIRDVVRILK